MAKWDSTHCSAVDQSSFSDNLTAAPKRRKGKQRAIELPRHCKAMNALAVRCGFTVLTRIAVEDGVQKFLADWQGTRSALSDLGIFKPGQLRRLPVTRGVLFANGYFNPWNLPLLIGMLTVRGETIGYEVDFGELPKSVSMQGDIEVVTYEDFVTYHGSANELIESGICDATRLPIGYHAFRKVRDWSTHRAPQKVSSARRQPDGTVLFRIESDSVFAARVEHDRERRREHQMRTQMLDELENDPSMEAGRRRARPGSFHFDCMEVEDEICGSRQEWVALGMR